MQNARISQPLYYCVKYYFNINKTKKKCKLSRRSKEKKKKKKNKARDVKKE